MRCLLTEYLPTDWSFRDFKAFFDLNPPDAVAYFMNETGDGSTLQVNVSAGGCVELFANGLLTSLRRGIARRNGWMEVISQDITERAGRCSKLLVATVEQIWILSATALVLSTFCNDAHLHTKKISFNGSRDSVELPSNGAYSLASWIVKIYSQVY